MTRSCPIDDHPRRHVIESSIAVGTSLVKVAHFVQVGKGGVRWHVRHCMRLPRPPVMPDQEEK